MKFVRRIFKGLSDIRTLAFMVTRGRTDKEVIGQMDPSVAEDTEEKDHGSEIWEGRL